MSLIIISLYFLPTNSRKIFLKDLNKVKVGMSVLEVEAIMSKYMKGTGWPANPNSKSSEGGLTEVGSGITMKTINSPSGELIIKDSITYRHSNKPEYNSDWGVVKFSEGKVISTNFMPD